MKMLALALALAAALLGYLGLARPLNSATVAITVEPTAERIQRGKLLSDLGGCDRCHSERDWTRFGAPVPAGREGGGSTGPNITPAGIGRHTDAEVLASLREGPSHEHLRRLSDSDAEALVAWLRTLSPVPGAANCPMDGVRSWLSRLTASTAARASAGPPAEPQEYGEYLAGIGGCAGCHTKQRGAPFAGGREFRIGRAVVASANLTPDPYSGIGRWSERDFVERFQQYRGYAAHGSPEVGPSGATAMPWLGLSQLPEAELAAIYHYLRSLPPVRSTAETR